MTHTVSSRPRTLPRWVLFWEKRDFIKIGLVYVFLSLPFYYLIALYYNSTVELQGTALEWTFLVAGSIGHFALLAFVPFVLISLIGVLLPYRALYLTLLLLIGFLWMVGLVVDASVYTRYFFHLNGTLLSMVLNAGRDVFHFGWLDWTLIALGIIGVFLLNFALLTLAFFLAPSSRKWRWPRRFVGTVALLSLLTAHLVHAYADASNELPVKRLSTLYPLVFATTARNVIWEHGWVSKTKALANLRKYNTISQKSAGNIAAYPRHPLQCANTPQKPNILFILLDTWRYDVAEVMPKLKMHAENMWVYDNHLSGGNATGTGVFSLFYGISAYWRAFYNQQKAPIFMDELRKENYALGIFQSANISDPEFDITVFSGIPRKMLHTGNDILKHQSSPSERDKAIFKGWQDWVEKHVKTNPQQPFFGFVFFDALHGYDLPPEYPHRFLPDKRPTYVTLRYQHETKPLRNLQRNVALFLDDKVDAIIQKLKALGIYDNTYVVILGDHAEEFDDNNEGFWGHGSNFTNAQTQTPLYIHTPNGEHHHVTETTSHYDVVPSLMTHALNCQNPASDYSFGVDILSNTIPHRKQFLVADYTFYGVIRPDDGLILVQNQTGYYEMRDSHYAPSKKPMSTFDMSEVFKWLSAFSKGSK